MAQEYPTTAGSTMPDLSDAHRRMLFEGSGIDLDVVEERGVRTVTKGRELPAEFSKRQRKLVPGILFTAHRPNGKTTTILRPDVPDPENPGAKYEQSPKKKPDRKRGGPGNVLDVHPSIHHLIKDDSVPVVFVEGIKKADSITTAARAAGIDLLVVAISGIWNWLSEGEPIPDMLDLPVSGRRSLVCYDSDMLRKPEVQMAAERLAEHLKQRGAEVEVVYFSDQPDGSKCGADDFLVGGGTLEELLALARPYRLGDLQRERLSRSEKLRRALAYLKRQEEEMPAKTRRQCSMRATWRALVAHAEKRGKLGEDGIEGWLSSRVGADMSAMSQPTFSACLRDLEAEGYLRRGERKTKEQATPYVLLVPGGVLLYHYRKKGGPGDSGKEQESSIEREVTRGEKVIPPLAALPEMRWSSPGRKPRHGLVKDTRMVRQGRSLTAEIQSMRRTGKKRLEIVRYLSANGGSATREELLEHFGGKNTTWRDFKKQTVADLLGRRRSYPGQPLSVGPPIVELDDDGIRLVENWREALEEHRIIGQEPDAAMKQKADHLRQRSAFLRRNDSKVDRAPTEEEMDEDREKRQNRPETQADPPDDSDDHPLTCVCPGCSAPRMPYATPFGSTRLVK